MKLNFMILQIVEPQGKQRENYTDDLPMTIFSVAINATLYF